jgi:hypothetical protein
MGSGDGGVKSRDVVGKRVVRVEQERVARGDDRSPALRLRGLFFEDGTVLYFSVAELEGDYAVEGHVHKPPSPSGERIDAARLSEAAEEATHAGKLALGARLRRARRGKPTRRAE